MNAPKGASFYAAAALHDSTPYTPPIAEILCVQNGRAIVVCGFLIKLFEKYVLKV